MTGFKVIVDKSTVPVGTAERVRAAVADELAKRGEDGQMFSVVSNPEFLKEGAAVDDFMRPDRIVIGATTTCRASARALMKKLYAPFNRNHERTLYMDVRSAEFTKYAANAMLATRISFMNELANLADRFGADIEAVRRGSAPIRASAITSCMRARLRRLVLPEGREALIRTAAEYGQSLQILKAVEAVNATQKRVLAEKIVARFGEDLSGRTFALWGLAFKPNTDDMREAPSRELIAELLSRGARIAAYDPVAQQEARRVLALDLADHPSARAPHVRRRRGAGRARRRCARDRHRMEGVQEPRFRHARPVVEVAGDLRRPQPVRAGDDERAGHRIPPDRPPRFASGRGACAGRRARERVTRAPLPVTRSDTPCSGTS
jgi:UDPglucose 6-dehydrogenase